MVGSVAMAQGTIPAYPTVKLTKPTIGTKNDSLVVRNNASGGLLKILPVSEIKGTTNLDKLATPTGITIFSSTGNDVVLPLVTATNSGLQSPADKTKLDGVTIGATANQTDAFLLSRGNHTGTQSVSTVTGLETALDIKVDKEAGKSLISDAEISRLSTLSNFDNSGNITALNNKVDKVTGKSLLSDAEITRLATLANYTHPVNHPPSIITQDASNRFVTDAEKTAWNAKQTALGYTAENLANKNIANGYAGLGSDGKLISSQLPSITISDIFIAASQAAMLAVTAETGDVVVRTDLNKSFILKGANPAILSDWQELLTPTSAVTTVFGRNGAVTAQTGDYTATMVGAPSGSGTSTGTNTGDETVSTIKTKLGITTLTGSNTGDETLTTIKTKLGVTVLSGSNTGDQTTITGNAGTATVLQNARTINGVSFNGSANITIADTTKEPAFTKNTAFNKNYGNAVGTTAEGNDSRIVNGQTAYAWGNHASKYPLFDGTGAYGNWGINISGNASTATNSNKWNNQNFEFAGIGAISDYIIGKGADGTWRPASIGETRNWLGLGSNAYSSTSYFQLNTDFGGDTNQSSLNIAGKLFNATNAPEPYGSFISFGQGVYTTQINSGPLKNGNTYIRVSGDAGGIGDWRTLWHSGNFNPSNYLPLTGGVVTGNLTVQNSNYSVFTVKGTNTGNNGGGLIRFENQNTLFGEIAVETESAGNGVVYIRSLTNGVVTQKGIIASSGAVTFASSVTASGFFQSSDRRLKTILKRDGDVAYFKWKDGRDDKTHIGYIAQEVRKTNPNQVQKGEDKMLSVNYVEILVEKIRMLEKRITELEKQK